MKIIVVDDDNIIRMGLTKMIEKIDESYEVISSFQNGALTLEYLKNHSKEVDLVITDIKMPVMTGIELIENSIKELDKSPLFLVLSGYDEFNYVTSVHPDFYASKLHGYTDCLVYIPYFVVNGDIPEHMCFTSGSFFADKVIGSVGGGCRNRQRQNKG